jgi:hypothetical protein
MRDMMKKTLVALASAVFLPAAATAATVYPPHPGTVTGTTYYPSGAFHGGVDIASGTCGYWGVQAPLAGSRLWNVTIRTTGVVCYGSGSGNQNEAKTALADGWTFRVWHFIKTANSYDRTCDRCQLGDEGGTGNVTGPHTHLQLDKNGTKDTSWYSGYTVNGESIDAGEIIGVI